MKRIISYLIIGMLVLSGLGAVAIQENEDKNILIKNEIITISEPKIIQENQYISVEVEESMQLMSTGKPMVPVITKTFMFPVGTIIEETNLNIEYKTIQLDSKIQPSPAPVALTTETISFEDGHHTLFDESIYESRELYPSEPYEVKYGVGIDSGVHVTYVNIRCNAQYSPANDYINVPRTIDININYLEPNEPPFAETANDFLIITHEKFKEEMLRLKEHKDSIGINTQVITVDEIYEMYNGVAEWEEVKMYMADAVRVQGIKYVLLAGGHKGQTDAYWVPEFRSLNFDGGISGSGVVYDPDYCSDLYFADIFQYDNSGNPMLSTWDTNNNHIYAEGPYYVANYDNPDYYPDVYLGRIPFRYSWEAKAVVDKIIEYESNPADSSWFKKAVLCGGDTSPEERYGAGSVTRGIYEGELICDITAENLATIGFESIKLYTSTNADHQLNEGEDGDGADEVAIYLNQGCGWANMQGHANPAVIGNHVMDKEIFIYYYTMMDMNLFETNGSKYPFMVVDGCHNAQYDVTLQQAINAGGLAYPRSHFLEFIPTDIGSWMVLKENGGGITLIGNTGLGYGYLNNHYNAGLGGWISPRWAHAYAVQGREYTGEIWVQGITDYINNFPVWSDDVDRKTIEERGLLGDPSIKLGGAGITSGSGDDHEEIIPDYTPATTVDVPVWNVGDSWTYKLNTVDFTMQELDDRGIDLLLSAGNIKLEVIDVSASSYITEVSCDDIDIALEMTYNSYTENETVFSLPPIEFENVQLYGQITWHKDTLAIEDVELSISIDIAKNLDGLPIQLPSFVYSLQSIMSIPAQIDITIDFEDPWPLLQFPLEEGSEWGVPGGQALITIDGSVKSVWLRIINIINKFIPLIPDEFAQYLPNIDISELLEGMGIPSEIDLEIVAIEEFLRKTPFVVSGQEIVNVEAGDFSATRIKLIGGVGNLYYSEEKNNFIQFYSPANDFLPVINNVNLELIE